MDIFLQSLHKFVGTKNSEERPQIVLKDSKIGSKEIHEGLESARARSQQPESVLRMIYRYIVCKYWCCFLFPIWWTTISVPGLFFNRWFYSVYNFSLIIVSLRIIAKNSLTNNWLYIFRLQIYLWFRKLPEPRTNLVNPRLIYLHLQSTEDKPVSIKILQKLKKELSILQLKDLVSSIKIIQNNQIKFKILYLIRDAVFTSVFTKIHLLFFIATFLLFLNYEFPSKIAIERNSELLFFYILSIPICECAIELPSWIYYSIFYTYFARDIYNIFVISVLQELVNLLRSGIALWIIFSPLFTKYYDYETDPEYNFEVLDVICRLHREIKNESINFTIVTDYLVCSEIIPERFHKYFNFILIPRSNSELTENHGQIYDLGLISNIRPPAPIPSSTNLREWVDASLRCINNNATQFVGEGLTFLSLLIATNNGSLTEIEMLSVAKMQLEAFAGNYRNEISFKNQEDVQKVKDFFGYLQMLEIIPSTEP